jgi:2'-5' RNA ligase
MAEERPPAQRLFLALWPNGAQREQLAGYYPLLRGCGGREVPPENLHITLAFLGSVEPATRACLEQSLDKVSLPPFTLTLDQLGFWRRPRVVWLGAAAIPEPLTALVAEIKRAMLGCGLEPESRPFQAHLTLMRKAWRGPLEEPPPFNWPVEGFALVASQTLPEGARYEVLRRWSLKDG